MTRHAPSATAGVLADEGEMLADGWSPDTPPGDNVVAHYLSTLVDRLVGSAERTGGRWEADESATFVDLESAYVFDNIAVCRGPLGEAELDRVCERASVFFPEERTWTVLSFDSRSDLTHHGLGRVGHPPLMFRPVGGSAPETPAGLDIRPVDDRSRLADFARTLLDAYPLPPGSKVVDPRLLESGLTAWVGYVDDQPVATAGAHTARGLTEVEWVSTAASHRGLGIGASMVWTASTVDPTAPAALIATDPGRPVYERLGYIPLLRLTMWART